MIVKVSSVKGLQIFDLSQSKNIGKAQDVLYNSDLKKIEAIVISKSGMMSEGKAILINEIKSIGKDAIVIESAGVIKTESSLPPNIVQLMKSEESIPKSQVMTDSGVNLGKVSDLLFDSSTGMVQELELSQGPIKDLESGKKTIKVNDIVSMSKEIILVKSTAEEETKKQAEEKGIKGTVNKLSSSVKQKTQKIQEKTKQSPPDEQVSFPQKNEDPAEKLKETGIEIRGKKSPKI